MAGGEKARERADGRIGLCWQLSREVRCALPESRSGRDLLTAADVVGGLSRCSSQKIVLFYPELLSLFCA